MRLTCLPLAAGTGFCIAYSGPVGALVCFLIVGIDVFFVMQCLGEMSTLFPIQGNTITALQRNEQSHVVFRCFYRAGKSLCRSSIGVLFRMELLVSMGVYLKLFQETISAFVANILQGY